MMKTVRKITLSPSQDIPFDKLILNHSNVRRSRPGLSVENLVEDIALVPLTEFKRAGYRVRASRRAWFSCGKMHRVTPALLAVYAENGVMLEQPMAFTVNSGQARQVQIWDVVNSSWNKEPFQLCHMLTDLFQGDDGG
ncbi:hypothetical protein [Sulfitobacter sp. 20_GPM-1509m]|uniref:hypothetical protein n=1 Tax=Sulfitobacter sp. 20_GPM-1509m TaxID=1380367 RepID=UPI0012DD6B4F|nr:hypothetical protein [Sulfitobacter sp. 20_GPM-1509m]